MLYTFAYRCYKHMENVSSFHFAAAATNPCTTTCTLTTTKRDVCVCVFALCACLVSFVYCSIQFCSVFSFSTFAHTYNHHFGLPWSQINCTINHMHTRAKGAYVRMLRIYNYEHSIQIGVILAPLRSYRWRQYTYVMKLKESMDGWRESNSKQCMYNSNCQINSYCVVIENGMRKKGQTNSIFPRSHKHSGLGLK